MMKYRILMWPVKIWQVHSDRQWAITLSRKKVAAKIQG
jgi:hypothetical protein